MYPGEKVWDAEANEFVTVANANEAIARDPKRYSRQPPPPPEPPTEPVLEPAPKKEADEV